MHQKHFVSSWLHLLALLLLLLQSSNVFAKEDEFYFSNNDGNLLDNLLVQPKVLVYDEKKATFSRTKRSATPEEVKFEDEMRVKLFSPTVITLEVDDWILLLEENVFISYGMNFQETWVSNEVDSKNDKPSDCKFYKGTVLYEIGSTAIMTVCDNKYYYGFFNTGHKSFFVEPTNHPVDGHIVYKAKAPKDEETVYINKSKKKQYNDDVNESLSDDKAEKIGSVKVKRCTDCNIPERFNLTGDTLFDDTNYNFSEDEVQGETVKMKSAEGEVTPNKEIEPEEKKKVLYEEKVYPRRVKKHDEEEVGYFADTVWQTRPYPSKSSTNTKSESTKRERWLELALAVDYTVINFHGKDKIKQYIMALLNIVSVIYKDPSLDSNMHLVMARLIFYYDKKDSQIKEGNAKKSLEAVNRWNYKLIGKLPPDEKPHDVAVWLTREYLGGPSGYAPVAGVCDKARSTALNKDEGLASAFIIAHELAHVLGLTHDGDTKVGNNCTENGLQGTIMAPTVTATFQRFAWSPCSKKEYHKIIKRWTCLLNPPKGKNHVLLNSGIAHSFSMDEQCRMEYGEGFSSCKSLPLIEPCTYLWCGHKNSSFYCVTKKGPPVERTQCGFDKWCLDGYCQSVNGLLVVNDLKPRDGGWSSWSSWSECSRPCSYGVKYRTRQCNNPEPEWGGAKCEGDPEETQVCKQDKYCWESPDSDTRANICSKISTENELDIWLPYDTDEDDTKCQISCIFWDTREVVKTGENVPDGLPCNYENQHHICLKGKCHKLGCDGLRNSTLVEDSCGECGGNGQSCDIKRLQFRKIIKRDLTRLIVLQRFSRDISMRISLPTMETNQILVDSNFHLAVKDKSKKIYRMITKDADHAAQITQRRPELVNTIRIMGESAVVLGSASLKASRSPGTLTLKATGPLDTDIAVLISAPFEYLQTLEVSIELNYTLAFSYLAMAYNSFGRYTWIKGECDCDGHSKEPLCIDTSLNNQTVDASKCPSESKMRFINHECQKTQCDFKWFPGIWEHCSATCGENGTSHRQIYCIPISVDVKKLADKPWIYMVEPNKCSEDKPEQEQPCNRVSCPAYWIEEPWTQCSSTCGHGISLRALKCTGEDKECGPRPAPRWKTCNISCGPRQCHRDRSRHCDLEIVDKYCIIPEFQKLCCSSCSNKQGA